MKALDRKLLKQLRACQLRPGIWSGCLPSNVTLQDDPDLYVMLNNGLIEWLPKAGGYAITKAGEAALLPHLWLVAA